MLCTYEHRVFPSIRARQTLRGRGIRCPRPPLGESHRSCTLPVDPASSSLANEERATIFRIASPDYNADITLPSVQLPRLSSLSRKRSTTNLGVIIHRWSTSVTVVSAILCNRPRFMGTLLASFSFSRVILLAMDRQTIV